MNGLSAWSQKFSLIFILEVSIDLSANAAGPRLPGLLPDLIVRSLKGNEAIALSRLPSIRLLAMISPTDCPSCYESALTELNRLMLRPGWTNRVLCCIVGREPDAVRFSDELRQRYAFGFRLVRAGDEEECQRLFLSRIQTPVIFLIGEGLRLLAAQEVSPRTLREATCLIDSLLAVPPGME